METPCKYNWDDLEVGRMDVNHSEKFFKFRHGKHEKISEEIAIKKELYSCENYNNEKENNSIQANCNDEQVLQIKLNEEHISLSISNKKIDEILSFKLNLNQASEQLPSTITSSDNSSANNSISNNNNSKKQQQRQQQSTKILSNIFTEPTKFMIFKRTDKQSVEDNKVPRAYNYNQFYEKQRQEKIKRLQEEEKKQRIFHSKPAPKFNHNRESKIVNNNKQKVNFTIPTTPLVLKESKEAEKRRKIKIEEYEKRMGPQAFTSREPIVLHKKPFQPKKSNNDNFEMKPFNLHSEKRLEERKVFDEKMKKQHELKKKQNEEEKIQREKELIKEIRKLTLFKAQPNPFK